MIKSALATLATASALAIMALPAHAATPTTEAIPVSGDEKAATALAWVLDSVWPFGPGSFDQDTARALCQAQAAAIRVSGTNATCSGPHGNAYHTLREV